MFNAFDRQHSTDQSGCDWGKLVFLLSLSVPELFDSNRLGQQRLWRRLYQQAVNRLSTLYKPVLPSPYREVTPLLRSSCAE